MRGGNSESKDITFVGSPYEMHLYPRLTLPQRTDIAACREVRDTESYDAVSPMCTIVTHVWFAVRASSLRVICLLSNAQITRLRIAFRAHARSGERRHAEVR